MTTSKPKTILYIDGFNLYYGCLRDTPYRWLNLATFADVLLPKNNIVAVKYFTAKVGERPGEDPSKPKRQELYLRALATLPRVEVILGSFLSKAQWLPLADSIGSIQPQFVKVVRTEEKGSDVNLATHMVHDGHRGLYEVAVVVTNDSDLAETLRVVRYEIGKPIGLVNPHPRRASVRLVPHASFVKPIRSHILQAAQFPRTIRDANGKTITKPMEW